MLGETDTRFRDWSEGVSAARSAEIGVATDAQILEGAGNMACGFFGALFTLGGLLSGSRR